MNRLQQLRELTGMSRADLSRRSDVSIDVIEQLEAGEPVTEAEPVVLIPGETPVQDRAVILNHLADALNGELIAIEITVRPDELLQAATGEFPETSEAYAEPGEETLTAIPLIGVNFPESEDLPAEAKSHNTTEQPDDIDAALDQLAKNAQVTASEEAARVQPEPEPVSESMGFRQTEKLTDSEAFAESPQAVTTPEEPALSPALETAPAPTSVLVEESSSPVVSDESVVPEMRETVPTPEIPETTPAPEIPEVTPPPEISEPVAEPEIKESEPAPTPETYEPVPGPDMPGPAPAPEIMQANSDEKPEPPVSEVQTESFTSEVKSEPDENDVNPIPPAEEAKAEPSISEISSVSNEVETAPAAVTSWAEPAESTANLGITTGDEIEEIIPEPSALPPVTPVTVAASENAPNTTQESSKPAQEAKPTTVPAPDNKPPVMKPYVTPGPTDAEVSRYKLPTGTVITTMAGVGVAVVWFIWRSWRRSKAESERVAPYYRKK